jgi:hypothetical protein
MSRKLFNHFFKSKYIDLGKEEKKAPLLKFDWWKKYQQREVNYKQRKKP